MKILRHIGSLAFVLGLFCAVFAGIPWYVIVSDDPAVPWWLKIALFCLLGGILLVLLTVALEQRKTKLSEGETLSTEPESTVLLLNSSTLPDREITDVLGLVQGHTVFAIWLGKDLKEFKMKKLISLFLAGTLLLLSCAHQENLSEEEKEKYRRARMRYDAGQGR